MARENSERFHKNQTQCEFEIAQMLNELQNLLKELNFLQLE